MISPRVVLVGKQYPFVLQQQLAFRYTTQTVLMGNEGSPGEYASDPMAVSRFNGVISRGTYDVVLIMEGSNDLFGAVATLIPGAAENLRGMIRSARSRGVRPYIATIPPMNPLGVRGGGASLVATMNDQIRALSVQESITLVDVNQAFGANLSLLSVDGLHPNANGYALIAETFFQTLRATLEVAPAVTALPAAALRPARR
jgi:lysophospholipase L1-like esterase